MQGKTINAEEEAEVGNLLKTLHMQKTRKELWSWILLSFCQKKTLARARAN
jgi:hypothetical protein